MKTMEEHNAERLEAHRNRMAERQPHPNGIECPKCKAELWDSAPMCLLTSNPPQKNVHCPACGYIGFRLA